MSEDHTITFNLQVDSSDAATNIRELNRLLTTYVALARRVGLPENLMEAISRIQQLRIAIETLRTSLLLLQTATGPVGWLTALGGLAIGAFMLADQMELQRTRY